MVAAGCRPAAHETRVHVHARLTVVALRRLGLVAAPHKVACGTPLPALGLRFDGRRRTIDCPEGRRGVIIAACDEALEAASRLEVDRAKARRLTGRLCSLTQVDHRLRRHLHAGYRLVESSWVASGRRRAPPRLTLGAASAAKAEWVLLLETAKACLEENPGAAMAPRRTFPSIDRPGSLVTITDASGDDGVGGYALLADAPHEVFLVSEEWPSDLAAALRASADEAEAALRRQSSGAAAPHLPMPAAELGGQLLVAQLAAREADRRRLRVRRVVAVGDCAPATRTLDALHSGGGSPHMRALAVAAEGEPWEWLSVNVPREANSDADRLSHPRLAGDVQAEVEASRLIATRLRPTEADWAALRAAVAAGSVTAKRRRYRRSRGRSATNPQPEPSPMAAGDGDGLDGDSAT